MHMDYSALKNPHSLLYHLAFLQKVSRRTAENPTRAVFWETDIRNKNHLVLIRGQQIILGSKR